MEDLTFSEYAKKIGLPRTTLYTKLNQLKRSNPERYDAFVIQNENTLKIRGEKSDELKGFLQADYKPATTAHEEEQLKDEVTQLKKALTQSEEKYQRLFNDYMALNQQLQATNDRLVTVIERLSEEITVKEEKAMAEHAMMNNRSQIVLDDTADDMAEEESKKRFGRFF